MTWWAWIVLWSGLVLGLLAMLGVSAWLLFRKFITLMHDLSDLADSGTRDKPFEPEVTVAPIAVLADLRDIHERESARRQHRLDRRRHDHDARIARAKAITQLDPRATAALVAAVRERWSAQPRSH